jgi:hypothetical protein
MKRGLLSKYVVFTGLVCGLTFIGKADLLDFDSPPVASQDPYGPGLSYLEDGFRFQSLGGFGGSIIRFNPLYLPGALPNDGTPYFGATFTSAPRMDRVDGALFSISQIDLSSYSLYAQTSSVTIRGNKLGGTSVTTTFGLPAWDGTFHTYQFDSQWNNLQSVDFLTVAFAWDNIVATAVPEPATWSLLTLGIGVLLGGLLRRRRSS